jgi:hypothetical protein
MRTYRPVVAVIAILVWVLSAPLAMAFDNCMAMGAMCEGPCGTSSCITTATPVVHLVCATAAVSTRPLAEFVGTVLALPDPPPRASSLSV